MHIIIVSPSLDPSSNVSGISSVTRFIIENNPLRDYIHFEQGRRDGEKGGFYRIGSIINGFKEWKHLLCKNPDAIVHYNFPLEKHSVLRDTPFMYAALRNGNKMVVHIHGGSYLTSSNIPFPYQQVLRRVFSWSVPFITLSDMEAETLRNKFRAKQVFTLPNCIDLRDAKTFERDYANELRPMTLGYLGRITETKGMDYLLQACCELKKRDVPFLLKLAGAEDTEGRYLPLFSKMLGSQFDYCGTVSGEAKNNYLRSLDVLVMPTFFEGLPMSLLECMSYGVVPVITPVGSIPTVVSNLQNGVFIKVKDTETIVNAVTSLHANRSGLQRMSKSSRDYIFEHFDPETYISKLNHIYTLC